MKPLGGENVEESLLDALHGDLDGWGISQCSPEPTGLWMLDIMASLKYAGQASKLETPGKS